MDLLRNRVSLPVPREENAFYSRSRGIPAADSPAPDTPAGWRVVVIPAPAVLPRFSRRILLLPLPCKTLGPSHGHRGYAHKIPCRSVQRFQRYARGQTDTQTDRHTGWSQYSAHPQGRSNNNQLRRLMADVGVSNLQCDWTAFRRHWLPRPYQRHVLHFISSQPMRRVRPEWSGIYNSTFHVNEPN